ncbi:hypothetical protein [Treponema sp.]|uniref:hypothetical protein n=1 Tax=Treponema sp. TaxID=166 RepID=UPI0025DB0FD3|nr:hypothetical protein [Treponema sp.]MCR5218434.1 hypothetical protein [Treponema sp.]
MKKIFKLLQLSAVFSLFAINAFAQNQQFEIDYVKGNLEDKITAVKESARIGDYSLNVKAMDFCLEYNKLLSQEEGFKSLLLEALTSISSSYPEDVSGRLCRIFKEIQDVEVRLAVLDRFNDYSSANSVSLVNSYLSEQIRNNSPSDEIILKSVKYLQSNGNVTSFRLIFVADILGIWEENTEALSQAWGPLANNSENEMLQVFQSSDFNQKLLILRAVQKNPYVSKKIRSEIAENALSEAIYNIGETSDVIIELQKESLRVIADCQWTRAASLATDYFSVARKEYENGHMTAEDFAAVITDIAAIASDETGHVLSEYLDFLNKSKEFSNAPVEAVVLSVINALGGLGDKTAFDYLLYVTYLDYSPEVITAARNALAKLKW